MIEEQGAERGAAWWFQGFAGPVSAVVGVEGTLGREWDKHLEIVATADSGHGREERKEDREWTQQDLRLSLCVAPWGTIIHLLEDDLTQC